MTHGATNAGVVDVSAGIAQGTRATRRARVWFWCLTVVAVLDMGWLYTSLTAAPSAVVGLSVAAAGLSLVPLLVQAARVRAAISTFVRVPAVVRDKQQGAAEPAACAAAATVHPRARDRTRLQ